VTNYALRRHRLKRQNRVDTALCVPEWAARSYLPGQLFTVSQAADGTLTYTPVLGELQPPVTVRADGRVGLKGPQECPECGKLVDARGMKNHVAWVHRGVVPAWRKAKRR
jgi:hypothetical protein